MVAAPRLFQTLRYGLDPVGFFAAARRRHGDAFQVRVLGERWVILADPAAVREVFALGPERVDSGQANLALRPLLGTGNVLLLDGPEHLRRRRVVLPPFHGERLRGYEQVIRDAARAQLARWPVGRPAPVLAQMHELTFAVILRVVFGTGDGTLGEPLRGMLGWLTSRPRMLLYAVLGPDRIQRLPAFRRQLAAVDDPLLAEIARRRDAPDLADRGAVLSMLLQARDERGESLSDRELRDELATLLIAGHETTAALLAWAAHELARDSAAQARLAAREDGFADAVVTETLRLHPPVPLVLRRLREPATINGFALPAGTDVAPCTLLVHRRPDLYPDPDRFQPERFLGRRPGAGEWFPFGGSARRCLGAAFAALEAKVVLEELCATLAFHPDRSQPEHTGRRGIVLTPARGARVTATTRAGVAMPDRARCERRVNDRDR